MFWIVVALQLSAVIAFAAVREANLRLGREIVLETIPVDPRDLFRGDYVILRYRISTITNCYWQAGSTIFVPLRERNGVWAVSSLPTRSYDGAASDGDVVIRGQVSARSSSSCTVTYGIESYFVPEGTGRSISPGVRVRVAVDETGSAAIKGLLP